MAYREKIAWLAIAAMAIGYGPFFAFLGREAQAGGPAIGRFLLLFGLASAVRVAVEVGGWIVLAIGLSYRLGRQ